MVKLSELVKRRSELEVKIINLLKIANDEYETAHSSMSASLEKRLAVLH